MAAPPEDCDICLMPYLPVSLNVPGVIAVDSSTDLAADVAAEAGMPVLAIQSIPELAQPGLHPVAPIVILNALGRATSSLPALNTPGAAGLPGLTALRMASTWAILKYLWAFRDADPDLLFSPIAGQLRRHERSLFSEQLAIGMATHLVERYVVAPASSPEVVDIDAVFAHRTLGPLVAAVAAHRPDYLIRSTPPGSSPEVVVLEVKGNSRGRAQTVRQLARGVSQVMTVPDVRGHRTRRIVIGTAAVGARLTCYAIEVAPVSSAVRKSRLKAQLTRRTSDLREPPFLTPTELDTKEPDEVPNELDASDLGDAMELGEDARLLTYAGHPVSANQITQSDYAASALDADGLTTELLGDSVYQGSVLQVQAGATSLSVFTGVRRNVLDVLGERGSDPAKKQRRRSVASSVLAKEMASSRWEDRPGGRRRLIVEGLDGTVLIVEERQASESDR